MTEGIGSKHFILCEDCGKAFRSQEGYKEHKTKPCKRGVTRNAALYEMSR